MPRMQQTQKDPTIAPPSAPMLTLDNEPDDDIADPAVPDGTLAAEAMAQAVPGLSAAAPTTAVVPSNGTTPAQVPPTVPALPEAILPLAHGFCQYVQARLTQQLEDAGLTMARSVDTAVTSMADYTKGVLATNEHAHYAFADALAKITATHTPYEMTLTVRTPAGIPLTLTIRQQTPAALLDELTRLEAWLQANGYVGQGVAA